MRRVSDEGGRRTDPDIEEVVRSVAEPVLEFMHEYVCPKCGLEAVVCGDEQGWPTSV